MDIMEKVSKKSYFQDVAYRVIKNFENKEDSKEKYLDIKEDLEIMLDLVDKFIDMTITEEEWKRL